jgi:hypothetical protein
MDPDFIRYRDLLRELVRTPLDAASGSGNLAVSTEVVAIAGPAARLLLNDSTDPHGLFTSSIQRLAALKTQPDRHASLRCPPLTDSLNHTRPIYYALALHLQLAAYNKRYESLPMKTWGACQEGFAAALSPARQIEHHADAPPPPAITDLVLWFGLCILEFALAEQRGVDIELVDSIVHQIVHRPGPEGSLHPQIDDAHPAWSLDAWTYRELCGLHALANLALIRRNSSWASRVEQIARYHLDHTQPDHVTRQPWATFAFIWPPKTRPFADQQLHDAATQGSGKLNPFAALLLADAAFQLETLAPPRTSRTAP